MVNIKIESMKNIIKIAVLGLLIVGCTEIEPLQMKVDAAEKNLTEIKNYKSTEHYISAVWFSNWKADGNMNSYLSTLPDSLDIVILENGYNELTEAQKTDLKCVREEKGMKVLMTVDFDKQYEQYVADLEEAEENGESIAEEQAASEGREVTMEDIENAVKQEQQKVKDKYLSIGNMILEASEKTISESGLDGLTIRMTSTADIFFRDIVKTFIEQAGERMNKAEKTIVFEGYIGYVNNSCKWFDYIISTTHGGNRLSEVQDVFNTFMSMENSKSERFLLYLSLENDSWKTPYEDILSSVEVTEEKYKSLSLWKPLGGERTGGMAMKGIENDYENKYTILRETIQYLNLK